MTGGRPQLTQSGYDRLKKELDALRQKRAEAIEEVKLTRSYGDLRENFGYHAARDAYGIIESQIKGIEKKLEDAEIIADDQDFQEVLPGVPVTVRVEETGRTLTYTVVDGAELKFVDNGISADSPLGEALLYREIGETTEAETPNGIVRMTIVDIGE